MAVCGDKNASKHLALPFIRIVVQVSLRQIGEIDEGFIDRRLLMIGPEDDVAILDLLQHGLFDKAPSVFGNLAGLSRHRVWKIVFGAAAAMPRDVVVAPNSSLVGILRASIFLRRVFLVELLIESSEAA